MVKGLKKFAGSQLVVPVFAFVLIIVFNLIRDVGFFEISLGTNNDGNTVLQGNIMSIINGASELAVLAIGMTLVTASSKGQDISVGAAAAIAGSVFVSVLKSGGQITMPIILVGFLASCVVAILFGTFNGTLVAIFKIQPMIASLILFSAGRSIAYWINGGATPTVDSPLIESIGSFIPGIPIHTPIIIVIIFAVLVSLVLRFTNLRLYTQAVGINERSARLNGINAVWIKLLSFMILGVCVAIAGCINVCKIGLINHETHLIEIEMDAILAVAIGGNALSGGKFSLAGSVIGAYIIQTLTVTLYAMRVPSEAIKAYKAVVIIAIVVMSSPVTKRYAFMLRDKLFKRLSKDKQIDENGELTI
jgi:ribose/xylose/arabinose/galactoside ABC-type transport system permease subunit